MSALRILCSCLGMLLLSLPIGYTQSNFEVDYTTLQGTSGRAQLSLPLYALKRSGRVIFRGTNQQALRLDDMEQVLLEPDTVLRRFPEIAPNRLWQLLLWGDYQLYRSVSKAEEATYVLYHAGQAAYLHERNFAQVLNQARPPGSKILVKENAPLRTARLLRATRQLNEWTSDTPSFVYTPFELSRWQLEVGARFLLFPPVWLTTTWEQDIRTATAIGINYRPFTHLPYFWAHFSLARQPYQGDNLQFVFRAQTYRRSLSFTEWQGAWGVRAEVAPQWSISPYVGLNVLLSWSSNVQYNQRVVAGTPTPIGLPFAVSQRGRSRLTFGQSTVLGTRIQLSDYWSMHLQFQGQFVDRLIRFTAPEGSSEIALDGESRLRNLRDQSLQLHLQFAIR